MNKFDVTWTGQVEAPNPFSAAGAALALLQTGAVFTVGDQEIDLTGSKPVAPRSLRPGGEYRTRDGLNKVEILAWDEPGDFPLYVRIELHDGSAITGSRTKAGLHPQSNGTHPADIVEVTPTITRWVRLYDRKLNAAGKQVVGGKEFAAERGLFLYLFDTEAEARANLQGVRAVFPISYREGEGLS